MSELTTAAVIVAGNVSERKAAKSGARPSGTVRISRSSYNDLVAAIEAELPGCIARYRELRKHPEQM